MSDIVKVIRIVRPECPGGFCEINASDFDPSKHKVFGAKEEDAPGEDLKPEDVISGKEALTKKAKWGEAKK